MEKYLQSENVFVFSIKGVKHLVRPVNGEEHFNDVGFSHGIVHFADPQFGLKLGWSGVNYFEDNAKPISMELWHHMINFYDNGDVILGDAIYSLLLS